MALKVVFRRIRGRVIPIKVAQKGHEVPSEFEKVVKIQKTRKVFNERAKPDKFLGVFLKADRVHAKKTGHDIARRLAKLNARKKAKK